MDERPDHALVLELTSVLRALSERQRDLLAVIRQWRLERTPGATAPPPTNVVADTAEGWRTPAPASVPPAPASVPPALAPLAPVSSGPPPVARGQGAAPTQAGVPVDAATHTHRPAREYDYFDELDDRLAHLRREQEGDPI